MTAARLTMTSPVLKLPTGAPGCRRALEELDQPFDEHLDICGIADREMQASAKLRQKPLKDVAVPSLGGTLLCGMRQTECWF